MEKDMIENRSLKIGKVFCLKSRKNPEIGISKGSHKWIIYVIGVIEAFLFGGCISGWSQLVYILKNEEIFLNLCQNSSSENFALSNASEVDEDLKFHGCKEQDKEFALVYTFGNLSYYLFSFLTGMILHQFGLVLTRLIASLFIFSGFFSLGLATKESPYWLYAALILLAFGGNQLRSCGLQFCNLFPKWRSTAMTIISGAYAASAGLFITYQLGQYKGISHTTVSFFFAGLSLLSIGATAIMPWHHIPYNDISQSSVPFKTSFFSFSYFIHLIWFAMQISGSSFYSMYFNSWISNISETNEMAGHFSLLFGLISFGSFLISPLPGLVTDYLLKRAERAKSIEERLIQELKSPSLTLVFVTFVNIGTLSCLFFEIYFSVYLSLAGRAVLRSSMVAVGSSFLRLRFPAEHFDRLNGICGTSAAFFLFLQYPFFVWSQNSFLAAMLCLIVLMATTLVHPLHLLSIKYRRKIVKEKLSYSLLMDKLPKVLSFKNKVGAITSMGSRDNVSSIYQPKDMNEDDENVYWERVPKLLPINQDLCKKKINSKRGITDAIPGDLGFPKPKVPKLMSLKETLNVDNLSYYSLDNEMLIKDENEENHKGIPDRIEKYTLKNL